MGSDYLKRLDCQGYLKVRKKLLEWGPIGDGVPNDEYDAYAPSLVRMLNRNEKKEEMLEYLRSVCIDKFGLPYNPDRAERIVTELISWWPYWRADVERLGPSHMIEDNYNPGQDTKLPS